MTKIKKILMASLLAVALPAVAVAKTSEVPSINSSASESAKSYASIIQPMLPMTLNPFSKMTSAIPAYDRVTMSISLHLPKMFKANRQDYSVILAKTDAERKAYFKNIMGLMQKSQVNMLCTNPDTKVVLDAGVTVAYGYYNMETREFIGQTEILPTDCKK